MRRARPVTLFLLIIALIVSAPVYSGSIEVGFAAFKQGDKELALKTWLPLAIKGDARAQFFLSVLFEKGTGEAEDRNNAQRWLTAAANNGFIPAQFNLGNNYYYGIYSHPNNKMASYWWEQAAMQGFVEAQYQLGSLYYWGEGFGRDLKESFYWYEKAANSGSAEARDAMLQARAGTLRRWQNQPVDIAYDDPRIVSKLSAIASPGVKPISATPKLKGPANVAVASKSLAQEGQLGVDPTSVAVARKDESVSSKKLVAVTDAKPDLGWVQQQPARNRTIQLFASGYLHHCTDYVKQIRERHKLETHAQAFAMNGRKLCAVVYGSYAKYSAAKAGLAGLPREVRRGKPWIRKLGGLQKLARVN